MAEPCGNVKQNHPTAEESSGRVVNAGVFYIPEKKKLHFLPFFLPPPISLERAEPLPLSFFFL